MIELVLPWPPNSLSLNGPHGHWSEVSRARKRFRMACWGATLEMLGSRSREAVAWATDWCAQNDRIRLTLGFAPPDKHLYDLDGLLSRMKSGIDGMAKALQFNDRKLRPITIDLLGEASGDGHVHVMLQVP